MSEKKNPNTSKYQLGISYHKNMLSYSMNSESSPEFLQFHQLGSFESYHMLLPKSLSIMLSFALLSRSTFATSYMT